MPRSRAPPLGAPLFIQRLNVTLELRLGTHKTKPRLAKRLRTLDRTLKAADAWTLAAAGWAASPMNPKNAPAGVTATATAGAAAAAAAATAVPLGAPATASAPTAAEVATGPVDLDEGDERAIGVLQRLNTAPVTTAAAVAAPGDGGRGRGRGRGQGQDRARLQ
jgi:hypothetical protein